MRPKRRIYVIGDEEDASVLRCILHNSAWAEPSGRIQECSLVFVIAGTLKTPLQDAQDALRRVRGLKKGLTGQLPVIALHRGFQGPAMVTASLEPINIQLRGRLMFREWDRDWCGTFDAARVLCARKRH